MDLRPIRLTAVLFVSGILSTTGSAWAQPAEPAPPPPPPPADPPPEKPPAPAPPVAPPPPAPPPPAAAPKEEKLEYPVAYARRPLTLPRLVLSPGADFTY